MPHIPQAFCMKCNLEMLINKTSECMEAMANWGPYYKVYGGLYKCPKCGNEIAIPARQVIHSQDDRYEKVTANRTVYFTDSYPKV